MTAKVSKTRKYPTVKLSLRDSLNACVCVNVYTYVYVYSG